MFVCQQCGLTTVARVPATLRVVETRPVVYPERQVYRLVRESPGGKRKGKWITTSVGHGHETVAEMRICPACAER